MTAPYERWVLLGKLLAGRRQVLGYTYRAPGFERERGINRRLAADLETAAGKRVNHFTEGSLRLAAHGYQVTYESMMAVLRGAADTLTPAPAEAAPSEKPAVMGSLDLPPSPFGDLRDVADRPYAEAIWKRFLDLPRRVTEPSGGQLFPDDPDDAKAWDDFPGSALPVGDRVWLIADLRRRADGRTPNSDTGATSA